jgi:Flp pilus assembly protein TadD
LTQSNEANKYSRVATIRSLGRNYIAQHRFKEALDLANKALAIGEDARKLKIIMMSELGNFAEAESNLNALKI